jgi:hypothetical protein
MEGAAMQFVVWIETIIAGKSVAVQRAAVVDVNASQMFRQSWV